MKLHQILTAAVLALGVASGSFAYAATSGMREFYRADVTITGRYVGVDSGPRELSRVNGNFTVSDDMAFCELTIGGVSDVARFACEARGDFDSEAVFTSAYDSEVRGFFLTDSAALDWRAWVSRYIGLSSGTFSFADTGRFIKIIRAYRGLNDSEWPSVTQQIHTTNPRESYHITLSRGAFRKM